MKHLKRLLPIFAIAAILISACSSSETMDETENISDRKIKVVATTGMICDMVENIGGERVDVTCLMGAGVDPHLYKASESDVRALEEADIIYYNALHLEAGMSGVLERVADSRNVVAVTSEMNRDKLNAPEEFEGAYDPHVWFDVTLWSEAIAPVRDSLAELDPASTELFTKNAQVYQEALAELDDYVREQAERVPESQRVLITAHDAFNYFGQAYGFEVRGLQGISTETEAGTADVQDLVDFIVERQIAAIFVESSVPKRNIQAVQEAVQARGFDVAVGGELFSDAMGDAGTVEGTYLGMVRHNIDTIVNALLGE